jgi:hypothetical protein
MTKELSTAKFIALLSLRVDLGKPTRIPDPLPKAKAIVISDWPRKNAQLLLRLIRALAGKDEVFSLRDVDGMSHETLSMAPLLIEAKCRQVGGMGLGDFGRARRLHVRIDARKRARKAIAVSSRELWSRHARS